MKVTMSRTRILVIDDEAGLTRMLRRNLERTGRFDVCEENHAKRAVQAAESFEPQLILLDLLMPEMDGTQVAAEIRKCDRLRSIPIVFMSALVPTGEFKTPHPLPAPFLPKPVTLDALLEAIDHFVDGASATRGA